MSDNSKTSLVHPSFKSFGFINYKRAENLQRSGPLSCQKFYYKLFTSPIWMCDQKNVSLHIPFHVSSPVWRRVIFNNELSAFDSTCVEKKHCRFFLMKTLVCHKARLILVILSLESEPFQTFGKSFFGPRRKIYWRRA